MTGLRILHLAFEDYRRPRSGGGGLRTHEINRRLAEDHHVTVLSTRYPGARSRVEDGVRYRPLGLPGGNRFSTITYHLAVPLYLLLFSHRFDLVVEDFAAPMSSMMVPLWTRRPSIAVVQWLFARETSRRYGIPFHLMETLGLRLQDRFVAASTYMAEQIERRNPEATIDIVYAGVDGPPAGHDPSRMTNQIVYLGRLEELPKGIDLLLDAFVLLQGAPRLVIAGDGPDRSDIERKIALLDVGDRVTLAGRLSGADKWNLLARAAIVVVPSRYESFGMVALEALAAGTPVVAFAIPSMREIVLPGCGILVEPFDAGALSGAVQALLDDPGARASARAHGRARSADFDWDGAARLQERAYRSALSVPRHRPRRLRRVIAAGRRANVDRMKDRPSSRPPCGREAGTAAAAAASPPISAG